MVDIRIFSSWAYSETSMSRNKTVAIHQPNFFPWLGFFSKIAQADTFVFLDNVQYPRTGAGNWVNRTHILVGGHVAWATAPVRRSSAHMRPIREALIDDSTSWRSSLTKTLQLNYGRAPGFSEAFPLVAELLNSAEASLSSFNIAAIRRIARTLGLDNCDFVLGSELTVEGHATDLLISIVGEVGANTYLCGGGAQGYQEDEKFRARGIELRYQDFDHPVYRQFRVDAFVPGLSVIDLLMFRGIAGARETVMSASRSL